MTANQPGVDHVANARKIANATDDFIHERLPAWLSGASPKQINALRDCMHAHTLSQEKLHTRYSAIIAPDGFALRRLQPLLQGALNLEVNLRELYWREVRRSFQIPSGISLPVDVVTFEHQPALQRLMQNFKPSASFYRGSGLSTSDQRPVPDSNQADLLTGETEVVSLFCREEDIGQDYQSHLDGIFGAEMQSIMAQDNRAGLALAAEIAAIKGEINPSDLTMLRQQTVAPSTDRKTASHWRALSFKLLGCPVDGALAFEQRDMGSVVRRVLLYLPDAPQRSLYVFDGWAQLNDGLVEELRKPEFVLYLRQRIGLRALPGLLNLMTKRLGDPSPDLEAKGEVPVTDLFDSLVSGQVQRIKDDARILLVPTDDADHAASAQRIEQMQSTGMTLLNVAGLFVPAIGTLLLGQTVVQILSETFEGVKDWTLGHRQEAIEHLLGVTETIVVGVAVAAGAKVIARGFKRSSYVDQLVPINTDAGNKRLWSEELQPYVASDVPGQLQTLDNGLHTDGQRLWWRHDNALYQVRQHQGRWWLQHPLREEAYAPQLLFNGERGWRLSFARPFEWQGSAFLLSRLWPQAAELDPKRIEQILRVADVDEDALRGLLVENRPLPVSLRDTLERFNVDARIDAFFTALAQPTEDVDSEMFRWCVAQIDAVDLPATEQRAALLEHSSQLRQRLFEHFSVLYLPTDDALTLLQRDFPGLPDAYALYLLRGANDADRLRMTEQQRIPLALAQQARVLLRHAKLVRLCEGLFLRNNYQANSVELAFNLLRRHTNWPSDINLELREGSENGRRLAVLFAQRDQPHVMVWRAGRFCLYDSQGRELDVEIAEPAGLPEVILALLPDVEKQRLGWNASNAKEQISADLQGWLPEKRRDLERLMGWREVTPWFNPGQRLPDGRTGYLLSGRGRGSFHADNLLRARIRALYTGFSETQVENYLQALLQRSGSPFNNLLRQESEYQQLDALLAGWESDAAHGSRRFARRHVAEELRRCWRLEGEIARNGQGQPQGMRLRLLNEAVGELPELPANADFNHVTDLALVGLQLQRLPSNFLQRFSGLRWLNLGNNALSALPAGLEALNQLHGLWLNNNRIRLTNADVDVLANLPLLRTLNLNRNSLGEATLHFHRPLRLTELYLSNCELRSVPQGLTRSPFLEHVDLRNNQIVDVPEELLQAPRAMRQSLILRGNALPDAILERLNAPDPIVVSPEAARRDVSREQWIDDLDPQARQQRADTWDSLRAEPGSDSLFQLISELEGTSDYRDERADLVRRVWEVLDIARHDTELRLELFNLAASPRTCVDSVASTFSALEVRVFVARALQRSTHDQAGAARLGVARRLFRLNRVEQIARADMSARRAAGRGVDEVEISLAYRSGLARRLDLPGQPRTMQFDLIAGVTATQLADAAQAVLDAEATDALARYVSQQDFWVEYLRREHTERFNEVEQPFWDRLEALSDEQDMAEGTYLEQSNQLASERTTALEALAMELTRKALAAGQAGEGSI
ncbi:NEL-type E3 ubiquitin ligase domain-containing protein [Pseudomonas sp. DG56-2]|uniref:NEL-type E3 ubiquitin ligase domain-containing protein n=1 Tax=Pseudomonas sp. DG56-2 TaxID=2320270 RepID=UPI00143E0099|nr:NEL-type E3 ubiquitin ligase domain-containing protein [Pseudomonas sp. DG56-2]